METVSELIMEVLNSLSDEVVQDRVATTVDNLCSETVQKTSFLDHALV